EAANNVITKNKLETNLYSISLTSSNENSISENTIGSSSNGIALYESADNIIMKNDIAGNEYGVKLTNSSDNNLFHNSFIFNTYQVNSTDSVNLWDNSYPSGGNYWIDYESLYPDAEELDGLGIWDTPYVIDEDNQDNYPLISR
ncbi:MAG: right-handed parallel beta-helix repeat-containing protein, partial [Candidatus Bathyarchaeota archaeon]|nr:right-handed parallel beta-helix repeat-containing protein [Candidatus Bathyarchaeota archaeon]